MDNSIFNIKFQAKLLQKQSRKAEKEEKKELQKLKTSMQKGNRESARIYAENAIRKKREAIDLLQFSSRVEAMASRLQTANTMGKLTASMGVVVKGMERAMETMNLEKMSQIMDRFEERIEDLDVQTGYMESSIKGATALGTPQDEVDLLLQKVADEAGLEVNNELLNASVPKQKFANEDALEERLSKLRNSSN
ncbi:Vacuolar protein-sorting-associated protein 46 [Zancudomyces culisetae]|uniref:Vacuolar protein-sorting-associated protein 46 n=1 Tax=Zancudomyces culisetae TaxID=1213189 RepID=A0A1R1PIK2_ZANCU|nr:Vacuolar protein-sorting-associated protein 46 [Zancudomyces culisetae]OMH83292.1 Vacuolar protein-sorting-associated protein 46 [Zancudomyces culisetae]|eukprot:OMH80787.1 Vacuolar protein-sorting-associated protein 46 [Zancudomyces culisetae]